MIHSQINLICKSDSFQTNCELLVDSFRMCLDPMNKQFKEQGNSTEHNFENHIFSTCPPVYGRISDFLLQV